MNSPIYKCVACGEATGTLVRHVEGFEIVRCDTCGLWFVPAESIKGVDYDQLYSKQGGYARAYSGAMNAPDTKLPAFPRARRIALRKLQKMKPSTLLEVGCGVGNFIIAAERMKIRVSGTDVSANALDVARRRTSAELHCGTLSEDIFNGQKFDVACTWEVLEHVASVTQFISSIHDHLKDGGYIFLSTPNYESRYTWEYMPLDPISRPPIHVTFWNRQSLHAFLQRAGFADVQVQCVSIPASACANSRSRLDRWLVYPDSLVRPSQRMTLLAIARKVAKA